MKQAIVVWLAFAASVVASPINTLAGNWVGGGPTFTLGYGLGDIWIGPSLRIAGTITSVPSFLTGPPCSASDGICGPHQIAFELIVNWADLGLSAGPTRVIVEDFLALPPGVRLWTGNDVHEIDSTFVRWVTRTSADPRGSLEYPWGVTYVAPRSIPSTVRFYAYSNQPFSLSPNLVETASPEPSTMVAGVAICIVGVAHWRRRRRISGVI
ncbi:hypothetical protein F183_A41810 [Bryobacterales bacterium F-183]|nr:hypothetical protein F183_A41810 [Bryobacterales bacterium F-183]